VVEVAFTEWTSAGRLRAPAYKGLRDDRDPAEVVREDLSHADADDEEPGDDDLNAED
jgi:ATP-dependent DNA ligase